MYAAATTVLKLLQGAKVFIVPRYQRRYDWRLDRWLPFWEDILHEYSVEHGGDSQELDGHFLGSIVLHPAAGPASTLMQHLVIDGQQRLTTILVLLAALRDVRARIDPGWDPRSITDQYLRNAYAVNESEQEKLLPTEPDREAYFSTLRGANPIGGVGEAYEFFTQRILDFVDEAKADLARLEMTILLHLLVVEIHTSQHDSVNAIFNTLNSKSQPLTAADLVRNELLLHVGEKGAEHAYVQYWRPMEKHLIRERKTLRGTVNDPKEFVSFLWAREAAIDPRVTKERLFFYFEKRIKESLRGLDVERRKSRATELISEIYADHDLYRTVRTPRDPSSLVSPAVAESLGMLADWGGETTVPIALWTLRELIDGRITENDFVSSIDLLVGYLLRRVLAGYPSQTLNRTLTPLAAELARRGNRTVEQALAAALSRPGSLWVDDQTVLARVETSPVFTYRRASVMFILRQLEAQVRGDTTEVNDRAEVEHIMPRELSDEWTAYLDENEVLVEEAKALTHTLGNLTLLESKRRSVRSSPFIDRLDQYRESSFAMNHELASRTDFLPSDIRVRSRDLAKLLLARFPGPDTNILSNTNQSGERVLRDRLEAVLQTLPEGAWTTGEDLVMYLAADESRVKELVSSTRSTLARLVRDDQGLIPTWLAPTARAAIDAQGTGEHSADMRYREADLNRLSEVLELAIDGGEIDESGPQSDD